MSFLYWLLGIESPGTISSLEGWSLHSSSAPAWALVIAVIVVAAAVAALNLLPQNVMRWRMRTSLTLVRLAGFAILLAMVARLGLRLDVQRQMRPNVAVLVDTSGSMGLADVNGKTRLAAAKEFLSGPLAAVGERANLIPYSFNWRLGPYDAGASPAGVTHLVDAVSQVAARESDLQGIILLTDGKDTAGNSGQLVAPLLAARRLPAYPVVFGDEQAARRARVLISSSDAYVRLGDELKLSAVLSAEKLGEQTVGVKLLEEGKTEPLASRQNVRLADKPVDVQFAIRPTRAGRKVYRIEVEGPALTGGGKGPPGKLVAEHRVQVLDSRIHVLYMDVPRDERKILGFWLSRDPVVDLAEVTMMPQGGWFAQGALRHKNAGDGLPDQEADMDKYDVILLGDVPRSYFRSGGDLAETKMQRLVDFVSRRGGGLVTLGGRNVYAAGQYQDSALAEILPFAIEPSDKPQIPKSFRLSPTVAGLANPLMLLEGEAQANRDAWFDLPALDGCNRVGAVRPGATLLAVRDMPDGPQGVLAVQNVGKGKVLSLAMDSTWRWEMQRPEEGEDYFRRFWGNVVRYLRPIRGSRPGAPQIVGYQSNPGVGQKITLATRLVDGVFNPVQGASLLVKVTSPSGKVTWMYPRDGRQSPGLYEYQIALDEGGDWQVAVTYNGKTVLEQITAGEGDEEMDDPRACPSAMADFAHATGGKSFRPDEADALGAAIRSTPWQYAQTLSVALWNLPATLILLAVLICVDCFLRKRRGMV